MPSSLEFANLGQAVGRPDYRRDALLAYWPSPTTTPKATTLNDVMMFSCCFRKRRSSLKDLLHVQVSREASNKFD
jgi:hypothetical protein